MSVFWLMRLGLVFLAGRTGSGGVFSGVCELIMILGSPSLLMGGVVFLSS